MASTPLSLTLFLIQHRSNAVLFPFVPCFNVVLIPLHVSSLLSYGPNIIMEALAFVLHCFSIVPVPPSLMYVIVLVVSFLCSPSRKQQQTNGHSFKNQVSFPRNPIVSPSSAATLHKPTLNYFHSSFIFAIT